MMILDVVDVIEPEIQAPAQDGEQTEYEEKQTLIDIACCAKPPLTHPRLVVLARKVGKWLVITGALLTLLLRPPTDVDDDVPHPDPFEMSQMQEFYNTANIVSGPMVVWQR